MRIGKVLAVTAAVALAVPALVTAIWAYRVACELFVSKPSGGIVTQSAEDRRVFYRLVSKYQHNHEIIEFDVVVGCAVRVTNYAAGGSSYDAFRRPRAFAKATRDGGAIWQPIPNACGEETTENGEVPQDFLPGAVWFDNKDDFSLGVGYFTEDAFATPSSKLKFLGAQIHRATAEEYQSFQPMLEANLFEPEALAVAGPRLTENQVRQIMWDRAKLAEATRASFGCYGVARFRFDSDGAREIVRTFWPSTRPRFWIPSHPEANEMGARLDRLNSGQGPMVDGRPWRDYFSFNTYQALGFPTRHGRGMIGTGQVWPLPIANVFPISAEDGVPWASPMTSEASVVWRDVHLSASEDLGFVYCYSLLRGYEPLGEMHIPNYGNRNFGVRADGQSVEMDDANSGSRFPDVFYERDEFMYRYFEFGLH